jgi:hypothetical protein
MKSATRNILYGAVAAAVWLGTASLAQASFFDNFDSYALGGMNGKGGWKGWDNVAAAANRAVVNTTFASSLPNSVNVSGTTGSETDLVHQFSGYTSGLVVFTAKQYIPSSSTVGTSYFILLDIYNDGGPYNWAMQTEFHLDTGLAYDSAISTSPNFNIVRNQWVDLRYEIDLTANTVKGYYTAAPNAPVLFVNRAWQSGGVNAIAAIDLYSAVSNPVYYDDIQISVIPEPGSLTLLAGFSLLAGFWLRRKNAA